MADTLKEINCPACGKTMKKVFMEGAGVNVDICTDGCGGIVFDNREFKNFDENAENIDNILKEIEGKTFEKVNSETTRICPICGMKMVKNFASSKHEIQVDECYGCGAKFLDNGELQKIRAQFNTEEERSAAAVQELYDAVGVELQAVEEAHAEARANVPPLARLFNTMLTGRSHL